MIPAVVFLVIFVYVLVQIGKHTARTMDKPAPKAKTEKAAEAASPPLPVPVYPQKFKTSILRYQYDFEFVPEAGREDAIRDAAAHGSPLSLTAETENILVWRSGVKLGSIPNPDKAQMLADFVARKDPVLTYMNRDGKSVHMLFYRDYRTNSAWREQIVTPLIPYRTAAAQNAMRHADFDKELDFGDVYYTSDSDKAYDSDDVRIGEIKIGRLPEVYAKRYPYLIYLERLEEEQHPGKTFYIPVVRLYFGHKK